LPTLRILVVTNLYPPQHVGGYELGCRDVVEKLRARGHVVQVLTSSFRNGKTENPPDEKNVERTLQFKGAASDPAPDKKIECGKFIAAVKSFSPDVVYFWNQAGLSLWLPFAAHWRGCRLAFFLSDTNFVSWCVGAWLLEASRKIAPVRALFGKTFLVRGWPVVENRTCHFCSDFIRQTAVKNGVAFAPRNSVVAHWGIEPSEFTASPRPRWPVKKLLYAGQMIPQKGIHTAIAALGLLAKQKDFSGLTLSIAGGGMHPDYEKKLQEMPAQLGIAGKINFLGRIPRAELPRVYAEHDVLVFPSEWDEPFAITPLEAIASGLTVVGTTTGGSGELFRNRETAMTFAAGDAADCARAIRELCADRELFEKISFNARLEVRSKHTLDAMVDKIEASLLAEIE
jgi:glycosyltransferase involved in cell wall biosynthesis